MKRSKAGKSKPAGRRGRSVPKLRQYLDSIVVTAILALFGTTFSLQAFEIPTGSMEDTLLIGERVLVDRSAYAPRGSSAAPLLPYREIRRGDIVVFKYPPDPSQHFVKRVIGLPGDRLRLVGRQVQLNRRFLDEPYTAYKMAASDAFRDNFPAAPPPGNPNVNAAWARELPSHVKDGWLVVPPGHFFVMGDNRDWSLDSRYWGFVPRDHILGRPLFIYWSLESTSADFRYDSQWEWAVGAIKHVVLFPLKARWGRMFLPAS